MPNNHTDRGCPELFTFNPISYRVEKSGEAFREQKFKGMCVPEISDQLRPYFFPNSQ